VERASKIAVNEIVKFLKTHQTLQKIILVCFDKVTYACYEKAVREAGE